jgi:ribosomal protein S18 acetylase RimI-like enzyme
VRLLYIKDAESDADARIIRQLTKLATDRKVTTVKSAAAALNVLLKAAPEKPFDVLVTSPILGDQVVIELVCAILKGGTRVTLVPVVTSAEQSARAIRAGADAVLLIERGTLVNPAETFNALSRRFNRPGNSEPAEEPAKSTTASGAHAFGELLKLTTYFAAPKPREPITVEVVRLVDNELADAAARLIPQISPTAQAPGQLELEQIVRDPGTTLIIAREGRTIVGMLTLHTLRAVTGIHAWIQDLVVDRAAKGRGVSELLTREAMRIGAARGAQTAELTSRPSQVGAGRLYERLGFERRQAHLYRHRLGGQVLN